MKTLARHVFPFVLLGGLATGAALAQAPSGGASPTREQVKMERDEFLRTHRWDEPTDTWVLKSGVEAPAGVKPRAEVKAERDAFLRANRWDEAAGQWVPAGPTPRNLETMPRQQVKAETAQFLRTHRWDESTSQWVDKTVAAKGKPKT